MSAPERIALAHAGIGLCLDSDVPYVAQCADMSKPAQNQDFPSAIPPSALLPRVPGEPTRAALTSTCHPRGSGFPWPPEAIVSPESGSGRFPLAYAWALLNDKATRSCRWRWVHDGAAESLGPAEAIGAVAADIVRRCAIPKDGRAVLVIPNHYPAVLQQEILDAARRRGTPLQLLWRPVAAAMSFCEFYRKELLGLSGDEPELGTLFVLHLGLDAVEATRLKIVKKLDDQGVAHFLPARSRPRGVPLPGYGITIAERLARRFFELSADNLLPWSLLWGTDWLPLALDSLRRGGAWHTAEAPSRLGASASTAGSLQQIWDEVCPLITAQTADPFDGLTGAVPRFPSREEVARWHEDAMFRHVSGRLLGAVVTGCFAAVPLRGRTLAERWLKKAVVPFPRVLLEGRELPLGVLAQAAARHAQKLALGLPTYFDTLPRIQVIVTKRGDPVWEDLLEKEDAYVDGGKTCRRRAVGKGVLYLTLGSREFPIDLNHEEYPTVRTVSCVLPTRRDSQIPVSLTVSLMPAQGNAQIEVVPDDPDTARKVRIVADWHTMKDTGKSPKEFLAGLPRICPPLAVRLQSAERFQEVMYLIRELPQTRDEDRAILALRNINRALQQPFRFDRSGYALGSDGVYPTADDRFPNFIERLIELVTGARVSDKLRDTALRVLANTFTPAPRLETFLEQRIKDRRIRLNAAELLAIGRCLRSPRAIAEFASVLHDKLVKHPKALNNWLRAFSEFVKYREDALQLVSGDLCRVLLTLLHTQFDQSYHSSGQVKAMFFRHSCVGIVYLLRRRIFENGFLDPSTILAGHLKHAFRSALDLAVRGILTLPRGMVDLQRELQNFIDYIDRQGRGSIVMAESDDSEEEEEE